MDSTEHTPAALGAATPGTTPGTEGESVTAMPWAGLRRLTDARLALGRAGHSQPTAAHLAFALAHAQARDAVHWPLDVLGVGEALQALGLEVLPLHSAAPNRSAYLQRPDWGRRLDAASVERLQGWTPERQQQGPGGALDQPPDLALVVADGLSALAVTRHAAPLLAHLLPRLRADQPGWTLAPLALVAQGRVAVGDEVGQVLRARCVVVLIGERPGLSSPDSLGIYLSWAPRLGLSDAQRNCISNVRTAGLTPQHAADKLHALLLRARGLGVSGVGLKEETDSTQPLLTTA